MSECERVIFEKYWLPPGPESSHPAGTLRGGAGRSGDSCCTGQERTDDCCGRAGGCAAAAAAAGEAGEVAGAGAGAGAVEVARAGAGVVDEGGSRRVGAVAGDGELSE